MNVLQNDDISLKKKKVFIGDTCFPKLECSIRKSYYNAKQCLIESTKK